VEIPPAGNTGILKMKTSERLIHRLKKETKQPFYQLVIKQKK
jgi:hypothetical protein